MTDTRGTSTTTALAISREGDGQLRYRCAQHGIYVTAPRRFVRWEDGQSQWSSYEGGPFSEDHSSCPKNTWSEERES